MTSFICFTGAQGTGKTTMRQHLVTNLRDHGLGVMEQYSGIVNSISREAQDKGYLINEQTNFETQRYIALRYMLADVETRKEAESRGLEYVILDRSVLDAIPYVNASQNISSEQKSYLETMLLNHFLRMESQLVYCEPLDMIIPDKYRSIDLSFQKTIVNHFEYLIDRLDSLNIPVLRLRPMPVDERLIQCIQGLGI